MNESRIIVTVNYFCNAPLSERFGSDNPRLLIEMSFGILVYQTPMPKQAISIIKIQSA